MEKARRKIPTYRERIVSVTGDCCLPNLGLSDHENGLLKTKVDIVFHVAASVSFREPLMNALKTNVGGTRNVLNFCGNMKNLKVIIVHLSLSEDQKAQETSLVATMLFVAILIIIYYTFQIPPHLKMCYT